MEQTYKKAYETLNKAQLEAVTNIEGPLLVVAGPGTGKTQLLTTRVGYILKETDTLPESILCLTFTESGAIAMRQRLNRLIGEAAYDVQISTYHAFGSELIRRYPEYVSTSGLEPIDDVGMNTLIREILDEASYANPYKSANVYASNLLGFISEAKRALLTPELLQKIAADNQKFITAASKLTIPLFEDFTRMSKSSIPLFEKLLEELEIYGDEQPVAREIETLGAQSFRELAEAIVLTYEMNGKTNLLTKWKNKWLARNADAQMIMGGKQVNERLLYSTDIYKKYLDKLASRDLFDYDDMILRAIDALENNPDFKLTLAERYQHIMLDEFQDTNPSQFRLIELLSDSPVNEGRPNIMAVGDDDQAIYAFQGALYSNMLNFLELYKDVGVVTLTDNYRSHRDILHVAHGLAESIETRLHKRIEGVQKVLEAAGKNLPAKAVLARHEFVTEPDENAWVAKTINKLIKDGLPADQIAVLAPKHKYLQSILPCLAAEQVDVWYEKRENVLDEQHVRMLEQMARLALALRVQAYELSDSLWAEVLSYEFWQLQNPVIWQLSWEANAQRLPWTNLLLENEATKPIVEYFLELSSKLHITTLEQQLDSLIGVEDDSESLPQTTFYEYYFKDRKPADYLALLGNLTVLRERLRRYKRDSDEPLGLGDFIGFIDAHRAANLPIINTSPYQASDKAVQLMTAYKAKGLEFEAVFLIAASDEVWGSASKNRGNTVSLPENLKPIRYGGADDDERRRLLYVAATRAKSKLFLTSYAQNFDGRPTNRLKYLGSDSVDIVELPAASGQQMQANLELYWGQRHLPPLEATLKALLAPKLEKYQLSPTHLNSFTDVQYAGPQAFFINTILRFPKAPGVSGQYGNAIHETLEWAHSVVQKTNTPPTTEQVIQCFTKLQKAKRLSAADTEQLTERGATALGVYWPAMSMTFNQSDRHEFNFRNEGVLVDGVHLAGKIDKLVIDSESKTITVVDFKTGKSHSRWEKTPKLHKYRQQLLAYKLLVEGSHTFRGYEVTGGRLEFVEPDDDGQIVQLDIKYEQDELVRLKKLLGIMWRHVAALDFPDTSAYPPTIAGILSFEDDLLDGKFGLN